MNFGLNERDSTLLAPPFQNVRIANINKSKQ